MKLILLGDIHFDLNNGNEEIFNIQMSFFEDQLFPYMRENKIDNIFQFGDFTDNRNSISMNIQHLLKERFFDKLEDYNFKIYTLIGNHDIFYKNSLDIFSLEIFEKAYLSNLVCIKEETMMKFDGLNVQVVPWLLENKLSINKEADMIFGHLEMKDFKISKTYKAIHGLDSNNFNIPVYSGHYHIKDSKGYINYLGTPFQTSWSDYLEEKGFYVLDTETREVEFIENNEFKHLKVFVNSDTKELEINGFKTPLQLKYTPKMDLEIFKQNKIKIYTNKENSMIKNLMERLAEIAYKVDLEILKEIEELDTETIIEKVKGYDITESLIQIVEEEDVSVLNEILNQAKNMMLES